MAPTIFRYRKYCKTCEDYTLHDEKHFDASGEKTCRICGTIYSPTPLNEIPEEKIFEQRLRYKEKQKKDWETMFSYLLTPPNPLLEMFKEYDENDFVNIKEDDAGQAAIDEEEKRIRTEKENKRREEHEIKVKEFQKFKKLGRNDLCGCGSGKKYKKCCLNKWDNFRE